MDKKYYKYIAGALAAILFLQFALIPFISRQTAKRTVKKILNSWLAEDAAAAMKNFTEPILSPAIYGLGSYKIKSQKFYSVNGEPEAEFLIEMNFKTINIFPSGKTWVCKMTTDKGRWLAASFKMTDN